MSAAEMEIVYLDGLPYPDPDYLRHRLVCDMQESRRWRARAIYADGGPSGEVGRAYLTHAHVAETRANSRRRTLAEMDEPFDELSPTDVPTKREISAYVRTRHTEASQHDSNQP